MTELYIGSHLSTAGGWNALLERSHEEGGTAFAFFPRSTSVPENANTTVSKVEKIGAMPLGNQPPATKLPSNGAES